MTRIGTLMRLAVGNFSSPRLLRRTVVVDVDHAVADDAVMCVGDRVELVSERRGVRAHRRKRRRRLSMRDSSS